MPKEQVTECRSGDSVSEDREQAWQELAFVKQLGSNYPRAGYS